jgi:hypothetical protein
LRGRRCIQRRAFIRGKRYSILPVITLDGNIAHNIIRGSVNTARFLSFLEEHVVSVCCYYKRLSEDMAQIPLTNPYPGPRSVLVLDNCSIHHTEDVRALVDDQACTCYTATPFHVVDSFSMQTCVSAPILPGLQSHRASLRIHQGFSSLPLEGLMPESDWPCMCQHHSGEGMGLFSHLRLCCIALERYIRAVQLVETPIITVPVSCYLEPTIPKHRTFCTFQE